MNETQNDSNPYTAPVDAAADNEPPADPEWLRLRLIAIVLLVVPALIGIAGSIIGMTMSFRAANQPAASPSELAGNLSASTKLLAMVMPVCLFGLVLLVISMIKLGRRNR